MTEKIDISIIIPCFNSEKRLPIMLNSLLKEIKTAKVDLGKLDSFYNYFCSSCDGKSTKRVVKYFMHNT